MKDARRSRSPAVGRARESWVAVALDPAVVRRSARVALVVGTLLVVINYGDRAATATLEPGDWLKMLLTYCVPYGVATYAAVQAIRSER